jgi:hypothetical protein
VSDVPATDINPLFIRHSNVSGILVEPPVGGSVEGSPGRSVLEEGHFNKEIGFLFSSQILGPSEAVYVDVEDLLVPCAGLPLCLVEDVSLYYVVMLREKHVRTAVVGKVLQKLHIVRKVGDVSV